MIQNIKLTKFGKFSGSVFALSDVTIFFGANEAGKTTIQDALFYAICRPSGNKSAGKELKKRYGEMDAVLIPENAYSLDEEEYRQLYSIKAGDVSIDISDGAKWMQSVKNNLFTGGINPDVIIEGLNKKSSTAKTLGHMKRLDALEQEEKKISGVIDKLTAEKKEINRKGADIERLEKEIIDTANKMESLISEKKSLAERQTLLDKIREKLRLTGILNSIGEMKKNESILKDLSGFNEESLNSLNSLEKDLRDEEGKLIALGAKRREIQESVSLLKNKRLSSKSEISSRQKKSEKAALFLDRVYHYRVNYVPRFKKMEPSEALRNVYSSSFRLHCLVHSG